DLLQVFILFALAWMDFHELVPMGDLLSIGVHIDDVGRMYACLTDQLSEEMTLLLHVFSIWTAFGGNTRDLGSFGEETDKTIDLHQHLSRLCSQQLETASQITRDAVTLHTKTASQDLKIASECTTQPII
ncbi:hypothetical protein Tco_0847979, partial [Tanacetum coccineum]